MRTLKQQMVSNVLQIEALVALKNGISPNDYNQVRKLTVIFLNAWKGASTHVGIDAPFNQLAIQHFDLKRQMEEASNKRVRSG